MRTKVFSYAQGGTFVHKLSGASKLLCFLILTGAVMYTYDIRLMLAVGIFSIYLCFKARVDFQKLKALFAYLIVFIFINNIIGYFFEPLYGCELYGSCTEVARLSSKFIITQEQLFYQLSKLMKYLCIIPLGLIFFLTTNPSEFASSLNHVKIPYQGAYSVSLSLRYFPDIARQFNDISQAQQARGIDMSKKAKLGERIKNVLMVISPLIFSTLDRIEYISNAMDLRGFGKHKTRSWYVYKKMDKSDYLAIFICFLFVVAAAYLSKVNGGRFYNPFN